ncbi:MAG: DnaA N-terminal domain-containing protein [Anaeromyxobacteraceae bacterium]
MTTHRTPPAAPKRAPELRLPYPLIDYLNTLPGDYVKITVRLLQLAQWVPGVAPSGLVLDAGELVMSLRFRGLWDAVVLDREVTEAGRVSLLRRVLRRLERDGLVATRAASSADTPNDTPRSTRRDTPATIVRFLKFRDNLWPGNVDATRQAAHGAAHRSDTILAVDPTNPDPHLRTASRPQPLRAVPSLPPEQQDSCAVWRDVTEDLRRSIRAEVYDRWFAPLTATQTGDELVLEAPNRFHQAFVEDNFRGFLEQRLAGSAQAALRVRITTAMVA